MPDKSARYNDIALPAFMLAMLVVLMRTAWMCDDAYITLRTVDNFVSGHGLRWNVAERVQSYTHPLWMFILSAFYFVTGEGFYTTIYISIALSLGVMWMLWRRMAADVFMAALGTMMLLGSKAYIDYSTSGLENPLTHLLLTVFLVMYLRQDKQWGRRQIFGLALVACMGMLNRMDTALLFLPPLAYRVYQHRKAEGYIYAALAFLPFIAWEVFSVIYYGVPFPNTAYAKLGASIPAGVLVNNGLAYLVNSLKVDPLTLTGILAAAGLVAWRRRRDELVVVFGVLLYLLYIVRIGGDFMSGRFLTGTFIIAVALIVSRPMPGGRRAVVGAAACVVVLGAMCAYPPVLSGPDYGLDRGELVEKGGFYKWANKGEVFFEELSVDERAYYFQTAGMFRKTRAKGHRNISNMWCYYGVEMREKGKRILAFLNIGFLGYCGGPEIHVIDTLALADPLLARLPAEFMDDFDPGHIDRNIPAGYPESILLDENRIEDKRIAALYDDLRLLTRSGELISKDRLKAIWRVNTGAFELPASADEYRAS